MNTDPFITSRIAAGLSPKTIAWYTWLLSRYTAHCTLHMLDPALPASVETFLVQLRRDGQAPASVAAYHRALRVYFGWMMKRGYLQANPMLQVERPRVPRQRKRHVTVSEFRRLYDGIVGATWLDDRDRALLVVMFYSGLRVGEVVGLQRADVDLAHRLITIRQGKGGHSRIVPCAPLLADPLMMYLQLRPAWSKPPLWISCDGSNGVRGALTAEGIRVMLRRRCAAAGLRYLNPHQFRHGFAMTLLNAGMEMSAVSAAMGHSSQAITEQVYAAWLTDGLAREYNEALRRIT